MRTCPLAMASKKDSCANRNPPSQRNHMILIGELKRYALVVHMYHMIPTLLLPHDMFTMITDNTHCYEQ